MRLSIPSVGPSAGAIACGVLLGAVLLLRAEAPAAPGLMGTIQGTVTDQSGQPIPNVTVEAMADQGQLREQGLTIQGRARTDREGRYSMKLAAGSVVVRAWRDAGKFAFARYVQQGDQKNLTTLMLSPVEMVYYPQAQGPNDAASIEVRPHAETPIDFHVRRPQGFGQVQGFPVRYDPQY